MMKSLLNNLPLNQKLLFSMAMVYCTCSFNVQLSHSVLITLFLSHPPPPSSFSWSSLGACRSLEHLDLSGCEKITDHTLKKLSVGLDDLTFSASSDKRSDRRARLLKSPPLPITLVDERNLHSVGQTRKAIIFKHRGDSWGTASTPTQVWVLNPSDFADIEDAADWSRRGGVSLHDTESFVETELRGGSCHCRSSRRRGQRTGANASYLHQQYAKTGDIFCGHSTCCTNEVALRTINGPQSGITRGSPTELWTKGSFGGLQCLEHENRTDRSEAKRSLRFLSLSGCYQVTDLGLR